MEILKGVLFIRQELHWQKYFNGHVLLTALQWFVVMLTNAMVIPLSIAHLFNLNAADTSVFLSNTFFIVGAASLMQVIWGHQLPIIEGPAGIWWGVIYITFHINTNSGLDQTVIGQGLELGLIIVGMLLVLFGLTRLVGKISAWFTPLVNGVFMLIMPFSMSGVLLKGMLGIDSGGEFDGTAAAASIFIFIFILLISKIKRYKWLSSFSLLIGMIIGWLLFVWLGFDNTMLPGSLFSTPSVLFWGTPELNMGILSISLVTGLIMLTNIVVSIQSMALVQRTELSPHVYNAAGKITGVSYMLTGLSGTIGLLPLASSSSVVKLSGVRTRCPFVLASIGMLSLGFFRGISNMVSLIPEPILYIILLIIFIQLVEIGFKFFELIDMNSNQLFIISLSLMLGMGVMFLPYSFIQQLHPIAGNIVGNGLVVSVISSILLEKCFNIQKNGGVKDGSGA